MKNIFTIEQAAEYIGLPRRTMYYYVKAKLIPVEKISANRVVMLREQVLRVKNTLLEHGRKGIQDALALEDQRPFM